MSELDSMQAIVKDEELNAEAAANELVTIEGLYFSPGSSRAVAAKLTRRGTVAVIMTLDGHVLNEHQLTQGQLSQPLAKLPYRFNFANGAGFETSQHAAVVAEFADLIPAKQSWLHGLERQWRWALLSLVLVPSLAYVFLSYALPVFAKPLAAQVPKTLLTRLDQQIIEIIDEGLLQPSQASELNDKRLAAAWAKIPDNKDFNLIQRDGGIIGANAFALPGGTIVVTDQLLEVLEHPNEITAVLLHEAAHVRSHHGMRNTIQSLGVAITIAAIVGDVSFLANSILVTAPVILQQTAYSRDFEREADQFAFQQLSKLKIPHSCLGAGLSHLLTAASSGSQNDTEQDVNAGEVSDSWLQYVSTHPAIDERIVSAGGTACE
ncbi:MAG: hypothetical protein COC19_08130 [SAR86 cluster bacterium]|uniref:Uncharacterized protein n=1 Tax=SAR86 cluster bacterium TaxID=2030880 RepID=A0A2A4MGP0_9GAMM|nr:MAG: hypothetical protein COC19_08130 [SAR86 cluster bacterium]